MASAVCLVIAIVVAGVASWLCWELLDENKQLNKKLEYVRGDLQKVYSQQRFANTDAASIHEELFKPAIQLFEAVGIVGVYSRRKVPTVKDLAQLLTTATEFARIAAEHRSQAQAAGLECKKVVLDAKLFRSAVLRDTQVVLDNSCEAVDASIASLQDTLRNLVTVSAGMSEFKRITAEQHEQVVNDEGEVVQ